MVIIKTTIIRGVGTATPLNPNTRFTNVDEKITY